MSKPLCKHITSEQYFCKECSQVKTLVYFTDQQYYENIDGKKVRKIRPKKYYSNLNHDKKGITIRKFKEKMNSLKYRGKWEFVAFYGNPSEIELDRLMP